MRCVGAGGADRVLLLLLLLLDERRDEERGGLGGALGSVGGGGVVAVGQALGRVAEDGQGLGDGVQGGGRQIVVQGIDTYGLRRQLRWSLGNLGRGGGSGAR